MSSDDASWSELLARVRDSPGAAFVDQTHQRSFSLNIFQMNAVELLDSTKRVRDPDQSIALMSEVNREAGRQAHREVNRHIHNFVASALTLVEHTRIFMRSNYSGTDLMQRYEKMIEATFVASPTAQFIQGLRNYFLHKGMPPSSTYLHFSRDPDAIDGEGTMETGVRFEADALLEWKKWSPLAREFLQQSESELDIGILVNDYVNLIARFHGWLDDELQTHHKADLDELSQLQARLVISQDVPSVRDAAFEGGPNPAIFDFAGEVTLLLDSTADRALAKVRRVELCAQKDVFHSDRIGVTIGKSDIVGPIRHWGHEPSGQGAFAFIWHEGCEYGLSESDYAEVESLIDVAMQSSWIRHSLSREFLVTSFVEWARNRFLGDEQSYHESLRELARRDVKAHQVWAPVAYLEVDDAFDFGATRVEPITKTVMANFRAHGPAPRAEQAEAVDELFSRLSGEVQGFGAIVMNVHAEPSFALRRGLEMARDAVGLLRFLSPAARNAFEYNPVDLYGEAHIPTTKLVALSENSFNLTEGIVPPRFGYWKLSKKGLSKLKQGYLQEAASLVMPEGLSDFSLAVRAAILLFSKGSGSVDLRDRLARCISALEIVLLKHEIEPRSHSVAVRMSCLLAKTQNDRENVQNVVRQAYWLQAKPRSTLSNFREQQSIAIFAVHAYDAIETTLANIGSFHTKADFIASVDRLVYSSRLD